VTINYSPLTIHRSKSTSVFALITTNVTELASSGLKPVTELFNQFVLFRSARKSHFLFWIRLWDMEMLQLTLFAGQYPISHHHFDWILGYWDIGILQLTFSQPNI